MATMEIKCLAQGQLPAAKATLFTATTETLVDEVSFVNTSAVNTNDVNLYLKKSGTTSRRIIPLDQPLEPHWSCIRRKLTLGTGDEIEADATNANEVDYVISGVEKTP
jgi:hypothetical protein